MPDFENGKTTLRKFNEAARAENQSFPTPTESSFHHTHEIVLRIERAQSQYVARLDRIEAQLESQLEIVAANTTSMSRTLELIQQTNTKLIDAISNKSSVPTTVVLIVIVMLAGIFLTRELAVSGGRAKFTLSGVDIASGAQVKEDSK
jgi:hypothetical protein